MISAVARTMGRGVARARPAAPGDGICASALGDCTLRAAIQETNALAGPDEIRAPAGVYGISIPGRGEDGAATGDLDITDDLDLAGAGKMRPWESIYVYMILYQVWLMHLKINIIRFLKSLYLKT